MTNDPYARYDNRLRLYARVMDYEAAAERAASDALSPDPDPWVATFAHATHSNHPHMNIRFWAYDEIDAHNRVNTMLDTTHKGWQAIQVRETIDHDNY